MSGNEERARGIAARAKHRATLFDLLGKRHVEGATAREPAKSGPGQPQVLPAKRERDASPAAALQPDLVGPPVCRSEPAGVGSHDANPTAPAVELEEDRIRISLTSVGAAGVVFALAILVFGSFEFGRWRGDAKGFTRGFEAGRVSYAADTISEIEAARSQPSASHLVASLLDRPDPTLPTAAGEQPLTAESDSREPTLAWIRDYTYIVVQEFGPERMDDVHRARTFLTTNGIETAEIRTSRGTTQLITTRGFDRKDGTQREMADQLLRKVHTIGAEYYAAGGGYKLEGYFKTLKSEDW